MASARLQSLAFALALAGLLALAGAGLYQSLAVEGRAPLQQGYGAWVNELAARQDWPAVLRALKLSAALDLGEPRVDTEIIPNLIQLSRSLGDRESELFARRKLVERRPSDPGAHNRLAWALIAAPQVGERERREAARHAEAALALDPGSARAHWILGRVALLEGSREAAFGHWEEAARLDRALVEGLLQELRLRDAPLAEAFRARLAGAERT
jgi:tetratricopeptide (TPR) repeat protein